MTNQNQNFTRTDAFMSQQGTFTQRRFRSRQRNFAFSARPKHKQPAATYFELLWSLPARKTLPQLLHAAS